MSDTYWANRPAADCAAEAERKVEAWFDHLTEEGPLDLWRTALSEYYAGRETAGDLGEAGEQGEFTTVKVNHLHNLVEHTVTAIAGQPVAWECQAVNSDHESTAQTVIGNALLESAANHKGLSVIDTKATRSAVLLSEGWGAAYWDRTLGEPYAPDGTSTLPTGEVRYEFFEPQDVVRDWTREKGHNWFILQTFEDKYDLAATVQDPEIQKLILGLPTKVDAAADRPRLQEIMDKSSSWKDMSCEVPVYELRHARTAACPQGRLLIYCSKDVILKDGPLPYRDPYVFELRPEDEMGSGQGYTSIFDLLAPQHAINAGYSSALSTLSTFGHPVIWGGPGGTPPSVAELTGMTVLTSPSKPEGIVLADPAAIKAHLDFAQNLTAQQEIISGVNAVRRGNLDSTGKLSGSAYALIDAKFLEYQAGLAKAHTTWLERIGTATIELYQDFATVEMTVQVAGKSKRSEAQTFTGGELKRIKRVTVQKANPLTRTTSGRLQLVEMLVNMKVPLKVEQIMLLLETGRFEAVTEGKSRELDNVRAENEVLGAVTEQAPVGPPTVDPMTGLPMAGVPQTLPMLAGMGVRALAIDNHPLHIDEHSAVIASPEARKNPAVVEAVLAHIQEHIDLWTGTDPRTLAARGIPPPPMMGMPAVGPDGQPLAPEGAPEANPSPEGAGNQPNQPSMPKVAGTNEQAPAPPAL